MRDRFEKDPSKVERESLIASDEPVNPWAVFTGGEGPELL